MKTCNPPSTTLAALMLAALLPQRVSAQTVITDDFAAPANWGPVIKFSPDSDMFVANGVMNYTCTSTAGAAGAAMPRKTPLLPTTQDWSMKVDVHLDAFTLTTQEQFSDLFLGFGKTGDEINTHVMFEFGRGLWGGHNGYYIGDDVWTNGTRAPDLFNVWNINITSTLSSLRLDYNAANSTITYYWDADAATGGFNWVAQGTANLASGTYNLNLAPADTLTVLLVGSSEFQTVGLGQAYLDNLEITIFPPSLPFTWITNNGTITITSYTGVGGTVTIPNQITGLPVTSIGDWVFFFLTTVTNVAIPDSVTNIGAGAFAGTRLASVTIPDRVTSLGNYAFRDCTSLASITIPDSVTSLGERAFFSCTSLKDVSIGNNVASIGREVFYYCSNLSNVTLGNSLTSIGDGAFNRCTSLNNVTIPDSVTNIGEFSFWGCSGLTNATFGTNVTAIGDAAFYFCASLTQVSLPDTLVSIGINAFDSCESLKTVTLDNSFASIGASAFASCIGLESIALGDNITSIGSNTFQNCYALTSITIPNSVTTLGRDAFYQCTSLTNALVGNGVTDIGMNLFYGCSSLESVTIGNSVTTIGDYAFYLCTSLTSVAIPNQVTTIGSNAFRGCIKLTGIAFPDSVTSIGTFAFNGCSSLTTATLGNNITSIPQATFSGCTSLVSITVPNSVTAIGDSAFSHCTGLITITVGNNVSTIADRVFYACSKLLGVYFLGNAPTVGSSVFFNCFPTVYYRAGTTDWGPTFGSDPIFGGRPTAVWDPLVPFYYTTNSGTITITKYVGPGGVVSIPDTISGLPVTAIGSNAFFYARTLASATIPDSVATIGENGFRECSALTNLTIGNNLVSIGAAAFLGCFALPTLVFPTTTAAVGDWAFAYCFSLKGVYCWGNAPANGTGVLSGADIATVYYLPGTTGWGSTYADRPTEFWVLPYPIVLGNSPYFGVQTNAFGFPISWASNATVVVDASTTITTPIWSPVSTNALVNGTSYFTDPNWTNYPARFYRVRSL